MRGGVCLAATRPLAARWHFEARKVGHLQAQFLRRPCPPEADQLRLMTDGGRPWETFRTENKLYEVMHGDAKRSHRLFRAVTMLPALVLPPRRYYAARQWLSSRRWYRRIREKALPVPEITRVAGPEEFKA